MRCFNTQKHNLGQEIAQKPKPQPNKSSAWWPRHDKWKKKQTEEEIQIQKYVFTVVMFINLTQLQEEVTKGYFYANVHFANPSVCKKKKNNPKYISWKSILVQYKCIKTQGEHR